MEFCNGTNWIQMLACGVGINTQPLYCWGTNSIGQLAVGNAFGTGDAIIPTQSETMDFNTWDSVETYSTGAAFGLRNGQIYAWGSDSNGLLGNGATSSSSTMPQNRNALPAGVTSWTSLAVNGDNNVGCAIANTGDAYCWGAGTGGALGDGLLTTVQQATNPVTKPSGVTSWSKITAGSGGGTDGAFVCGIADTGDAYCWGDEGSYARLGNGSVLTGTQSTPSLVVKPSGVTGWTDITASYASACAIADTGDAYCWGSDLNGVLGNGSTLTSTQDSPSLVVKPGGVSSWTSIDTGGNTCAIANTGDAYCWGNNAINAGNGGVGGNNHSPVNPATKPSGVTSWKEIVISRTTQLSVCAIGNNDGLYCWGSDTNGDVGDGAGSSGSVSTPTPVANPSGVTSWKHISGAQHHCAIANNNRIYCWGQDNAGQLGNGPDDNGAIAFVPTEIEIPRIYSWTAIDAGTQHACGIDSTGQAYCWGSDSNAKLGNGSDGAASTTPSRVQRPAGVTSWTKISASNVNGCAIGNDNQLYCWGLDASQQIGNGASTTTQSSPVTVTNPSGVTSWAEVSTGSNSTCGIGNDGNAYCWGSESYGELGNGGTDTDVLDVPTLVPLPGGVTSWQTISNGSVHTCAIANTGDAYCWGSDSAGQLGNGATTGNQNIPSLVAGGLTWSKISVYASTSGVFTCGLTTAGAAYCWGNDINGRLGNGSVLTANQASPSAVVLPSGVTSWTSIITDIGQSPCAIANTGNLYCWGPDNNGSLGNGADTTAKDVPTLVTNPAGVTGWSQVAVGTNYACGVSN